MRCNLSPLPIRQSLQEKMADLIEKRKRNGQRYKSKLVVDWFHDIDMKV